MRKIYNLRAITESKMKELKDDEDWNEYTYLKKYILPPLNEYITYIEKELVKRDKNNKAALETMDKEIRENAVAKE